MTVGLLLLLAVIVTLITSLWTLHLVNKVMNLVYEANQRQQHIGKVLLDLDKDLRGDADRRA